MEKSWDDLSREETVKALKKMKRRATVATQRNKGATFSLNQNLFLSYLDLAKEKYGRDIAAEVLGITQEKNQTV